MRMWLVNPQGMCRKHLLGEHVEMHMFIGCIEKGRNLDGYIKRGLVDLTLIKARHDQLVEEMLRRGYKHKSPINCLFGLTLNNSIVDIDKSLQDLLDRCIECKKKMETLEKNML